MELTRAREKAKELSRNGKNYCIVKATPGELMRGYYVEPHSSLIPPEQIFEVYVNGTRALAAGESKGLA